ncbi:hypothetical protein ACFLU1_05550 [Chloroflexota bacterium]
MTQRKSHRVNAYIYLLGKIKELNLSKYDNSYPETSEDYILLDDLIKLRDGISDPSEELVSASKELLKMVASEKEIEKHLVTPFK